ncbi:MAG TPA: DUF4932 domain-containing protein [Gemmatimonadaceae bacterium]|nr:DUF4932 domain-containing protein [Gemmatimonadaceae bacterium]
MSAARLVAPLVALCAALASAGAQDANVRIAPDTRLELVAIVFRMGGASEFSQAQYAQYDSAVRRHFEPFREHEAVALARDLHDHRGVGFSTVMSLAIAFEPLPGLGLRVAPDSVLGARVPGAEMARFAAALQRFARESRADQFFAGQRARLDSAAARLARPVREANAFDWITRFFGIPPDRDFVVAPLLVNSQGNYGPCVRPTRGAGTGRLECWQIIGHQQTDSAGFAVWGDQTVETLVHEISHAYANPLGDARRAQFAPALGRVQRAFADQMSVQGYTGWTSVLNESLVRAAVARFFADRATPERYGEYLADERGKGWLWLPELADRYAVYERDRPAYPTLDAFMPRIVAYYDSLPDRIPEIERAYEAGRPHVVSTSLPAGDTALLSPDVREIVVRFDRAVRPHRFAVVPLFVNGRPSSMQVPPPPVISVTLDSAGTTARLAVALEPGREYAFQLNTPNGFGFRTPDGVPLAPFVIRLRVKAR